MNSKWPNITLLTVGAVVTAVLAYPLLKSSPTAGVSRTPAAWSTELQKSIQQIDNSTEGNLGVYIKKIGTTETMSHAGERDWYFASTVKVPVAIATLQLVEEGRLTLNQQLTIKSSDAVDGSGELQFRRPGSKVSVGVLIEKMLVQSDSTATDMLIRLIGEKDLNDRIQSKMGISGFQRFTTILQVRKDAFSYLHPKAENLTNRHFIELKKAKTNAQKLKMLARQMGIRQQQLKESSVESAFEKYYSQGLNSGSLMAFTNLLEKLSAGKLLSKEHTSLMFKHMTHMTTGENRLKAGFSRNIEFAQKTGTQVARICNVGIATPPKGESYAIATCLEKFKNYAEAEKTLQKVGQAFSRALGASDKKVLAAR